MIAELCVSDEVEQRALKRHPVLNPFYRDIRPNKFWNHNPQEHHSTYDSLASLKVVHHRVLLVRQRKTKTTSTT